ncbi:MAG: hypothetical protein G01um101438_336 [Parcubacteria group bacterium Gr01-1014_38]|nr:MAG: hypothetical protein G01um101438_336 [Parcubacteria group bacterium Gr01-1014_38]
MIARRDTPNYRIYALVIGEILRPGKLFDCEIKEMSFVEQEKRRFSPIESVFSGRHGGDSKTYATRLPYVDPMRIKSERVVVCDIDEDDVKAALGGAIRRIERLCRFLSVAYVEDAKKNFRRERFGLTPYLYQVNKVYSLDTGGKELDAGFKLESDYVYLPNRPELNQWRHKETEKFLEDIFIFHDETLERAIKYLYRSSIGHFVGDSPEKRALDHIKSIEIILNSLSSKRKFEGKLNEAANKIDLTENEKEAIKKLWENRSRYGDVAHPSPFDQVERYPNQFPLPSNVRYPGGIHDSIAINVCLKYFSYRRSLYVIDIEKPFRGEGVSSDRQDEEDIIGNVNPQWESNHLFFRTSEKEEKKLTKKIRQAFAREYGISEGRILNVVVKRIRNKESVIVRVQPTA